MALQRIRHASVFVNNKKVAECYKSDVDYKSGDERAFGDTGVIGISDGAGMMDLTFDIVVPVAGATVTVEKLIAQKANVDIQAGLINGEIWENQMRFTDCKYSSDATKGTLNGTFNLIGGEPTIS